MKSATPALNNLLNSNRQFACADLFTITQRNGNTLRYTTADVPLISGGFIFTPYGVQIAGLRYRIVVGLEVDEQTITLAADRSPANYLDGLPFLDAIQAGSLDGARIERERAYLDAWGEANVVVGAILLFSGYVSAVERVGRTKAELRVKSDLALLDVEMPRNKFQAGCINTLYDDRCTAIKAAFTFNGTTEAGSTRDTINWSAAVPGVFWQGTVTILSGVNAGQTRTIKNSTGSQLQLSYPLLVAPAIGDTFAASYGCDKTKVTCQTRFSNQDNFRAFPFIPPSEMAF